MTTMHRPILFALTVVVAATAIVCAPEETKVEAEVTAEETALDNQTLDQLRTSGSDLSKPHQIEFYLYHPSKADAEAAAAALRRLGYTVSVRLGADNVNWLCLAARTMVPTTQGLTDARRVFKGLAMKYKGDYDGWEAAVEK